MADTNGLAPPKDLHKQLNSVWSVQGHQARWCDVVWVQMSVFAMHSRDVFVMLAYSPGCSMHS